MGVLVGIVFLTIEIRQNTELHKSNSRKAIVSNDQASLLVAIENHDVFHKLGDADVLSHADQYRVIFIFATDLRNREFEYFQYKSGSLDENTWKSYKDLGTERTLSWWVSIGRGGFSKKLLALWMRSFKTNPITHIEKIL